MINSREALTNALTEAAELEHGLLLQYIFAALSMKKRSDEGLTGAQQEIVRTCEGQILGIARQEMNHLGSVCNLLSSIGAAPQFRRPNFPQPAHNYYPFNFQLTRFSDESLYRFIRAELPKGEMPPDPPSTDLMLPREMELYKAVPQFEPPEPLEYEYIGDLYIEIAAAFQRLDNGSLFIGPKFEQDVSQWSRRFTLQLVYDLASAKAVIDNIVTQGEGSSGNRAGSHYAIFTQVRADYHTLLQTGTFQPSRPVVPNPQTRRHKDEVLGAPWLRSTSK